MLVTDRDDHGKPIGVSPDMAAALADKLHVPLELITFPSPGKLADAAQTDEWDIGNIGADPARAEHINFTAPYCEIEGTYLVSAESPLTSIEEVDQPGIRIATKARAAYSLWLDRNISQAEIVHTDSIEASFEAFKNQEVDVMAGLRPGLSVDATKVPGSRVLEGRFSLVQQAVGTPKGRDEAGFEFLRTFVEAALSSGFVADRIEAHGVTGRLLPAAR